MIHVAITTYNRPEMLALLISDLEAEVEEGHDLKVTLFNDASDVEYPLFQKTWVTHVRFPRNHGKRLYWSLVDRIYHQARIMKQDDFFCMMPDDVRLTPHFFNHLFYLWELINDPRKICINPLLINSQIGKPNWTRVYPRLIKLGESPDGLLDTTVYLSQWNDLATFAPFWFLQELEFQVWPCSTGPGLGSGVGAQISKRLYDRGLNLYQVTSSLMLHGDHESRLNFDVNRDRPLTT